MDVLRASSRRSERLHAKSPWPGPPYRTAVLVGRP